jgi:hypothetical protein
MFAKQMVVLMTHRQQEIVDHAIELIAEGGVQYLTIKRLASRLRVSEPALYRHFAGKADAAAASPFLFILYRLASEQADHSFLIDKGADKPVILETPSLSYRSLSDAITGETLQPDAPIKLFGHDGRWLQFEN